MRSKFLIIIILFFLVSCSQPKPKDPSEYVNIDFKNLSVRDFLKKVSVITGQKIVVDKEIQGKINFVSNRPIQVKELIPLANAVLETKRMTLINKDDYYVIGTSSGEGVVKCYLPPLSDDNRTLLMETMVFELDDLNSTVIRTKIKPLLSRNNFLSTYPKLISN